MGKKSSEFGMEIITLSNGAIVKSIHGGLYRNNIWYSIYGNKGNMESAREIVENGTVSRLYVDYDEYPGGYGTGTKQEYLPNEKVDEIVKTFGHGGSDYFSMKNFIDKLCGIKGADIIDVYEALDMFLPGHFAYRSILADGKSMDIPNLRNKEEREIWRNDVCCTDPSVAGDSLWHCNKNGNPEIDEAIYLRQQELCEKQKTEKDSHFSVALLNKK
jgi:hypothetical protein